jgi:hypothetical protein
MAWVNRWKKMRKKRESVLFLTLDAGQKSDKGLVGVPHRGSRRIDMPSSEKPFQAKKQIVEVLTQLVQTQKVKN